MTVIRRTSHAASDDSALHRAAAERSERRASWSEKGKMRARDEGPGGQDGIVLDLNMVGDGIWQA
jgi:hypothetical protein